RRAEHLRLGTEAPQRGGVDEPCAVALERGTCLALGRLGYPALHVGRRVSRLRGGFRHGASLVQPPAQPGAAHRSFHTPTVGPSPGTTTPVAPSCSVTVRSAVP